MKLSVATSDRTDSLDSPQTPCPEVQPPAQRVPRPTSRPAASSITLEAETSAAGSGARC